MGKKEDHDDPAKTGKRPRSRVTDELVVCDKCGKSVHATKIKGTCKSCNSDFICSSCTRGSCSECKQLLCDNHAEKCYFCKRDFCSNGKECGSKCVICQNLLCKTCSKGKCIKSGCDLVCKNCSANCKKCNLIVCKAHLRKNGKCVVCWWKLIQRIIFACIVTIIIVFFGALMLRR